MDHLFMLRRLSPLIALVAVVSAEPLLLSPLIKEGKLQEARDLSKVMVDGVDVGHSGYLSVPSASGQNLNHFFFWFQPCTANCDPGTAPFVQWLQGGPGGPSTFGAMAEIGNYYVDEQGALQKRCFSWCETRNCFFVDSPTMTGFSFQVNSTGQFNKDKIEYTNTSRIATFQLYEVLLQFLTIFPEYQPAPFYATGESYGGIYVPWLAKTIWEGNKNSKMKVNIKGFSVGDPVMDATSQWPTYATTLYSLGLIMGDERDQLETIFKTGVDHVKAGNCYEGFLQWNRVWMDDGGTSCSPHCDFYFKNMTGSDFTENFLSGLGGPPEVNYFFPFFSKHSAEFHFQGIPAEQLDEGGAIYETMVRSGDFCQTSADIYTDMFLTAGLDVNVYSSNLDPLLGPPTTEAGVKAAWDHAEATIQGGKEAKDAFYKQKKVIWRVAQDDKEPAGYARCYSASQGQRFCYTIVRNAGHMTPAFMPRSSYDMTERFIERQPFDGAWFDNKTPTCAQCGGSSPLAGESLPKCANHKRSSIAPVLNLKPDFVV